MTTAPNRVELLLNEAAHRTLTDAEIDEIQAAEWAETPEESGNDFLPWEVADPEDYQRWATGAARRRAPGMRSLAA